MSENAASFPNACAKHQSVAGPFRCARCGDHFCVECCYSLPDETINCHECFAQAAATPVAVTAAPAALRVNVQPSVARQDEPITPGQGCIQHPDVRGIFTCKFCGAKSCPTCDFFFPPAMHVCPQCAAGSAGKISPLRRKNAMGAMIAGAIATVLLATGFAGSIVAMPAQEIVAGILFLLAMLGAAVGAGLAMAAYRKGRNNSIGIWLALIWNFLLILSIVGLIIVGMFMGDE